MSGAVGKSLAWKCSKHKTKPKINLKCFYQSILKAIMMELCKTVLQLHPGWTFYKKANISSKSRTCSTGTYKVTCKHYHIVCDSNCQVSFVHIKIGDDALQAFKVLGDCTEWDVRGFEGHVKQVTFGWTWRRVFCEYSVVLAMYGWVVRVFLVEQLELPMTEVVKRE